MTDLERLSIAGRFTLVSRSAGTVVVGCIGSLWAEDLSPAQLDYIRGFYNCAGWTHRIVPDYPYPHVHPLRKTYNNLVIFEEVNDHD